MFLRLRTLEFLGSTISLMPSLCYIGTAILPKAYETYVVHTCILMIVISYHLRRTEDCGELRLKTSLVVYTWSIRDTSRGEMLPGHRVF
jgi:hypothetical protein